MYAGLSNYPAGVTGREYEIAGPDSEWEETKEFACGNDECENFEVEVEVECEVESFRGTWRAFWTCPTCNTDHEKEGEMADDYGPDPDEAWDSRFDD
jgi:hypothetical protein